jgi:GPI-GlcNAc transferase complex, PIG-H component.
VILGYIIFHCVILYLKGGNLVKEKLIVLKDIGIQLEKKYLNGKKQVEFVDVSRLVDIIIHEVHFL